MKAIYKKILLIILFAIDFAVLHFNWFNWEGMKFYNGLWIVKENYVFFIIITVIYLLSIILFEKRKKLFFHLGIFSLLGFLAQEIRFASRWDMEFAAIGFRTIGIYLGVGALLINIFLYIYLLREKKPHKE